MMRKPKDDVDKRLSKLYQTFDAFDVNQTPEDIEAGPAQVLLFKMTALTLQVFRAHGFSIGEILLIMGNGDSNVVPSFASYLHPSPTRPLEILKDSYLCLTKSREESEGPMIW
jgi:hypothetical protein